MQRVVGALGIALLAVWLCLPIVQHGQFAQDAAAFYDGGRLARTSPEDVYPTGAGMTARYHATSCEDAPQGTDCRLVVPFFSPPQVLPLLVPVGAVAPGLGVALLRLLAAVGFVLAGWRAWTASRVRHRPHLVLTGALLTPFVVEVVRTGQLSGIMLLSALVSPNSTVKALRWIGWASLVVVGLFKALPAVLFAWVRDRRLWLAAGALVVVTTAVAAAIDARLFGWFLTANRTSTLLGNEANFSVDGLLAQHWHGWSLGDPAQVAVLLARVAVLAWVDRAWVRRAPEPVRWAWRWCALLAVLPLVWWFYPVVILALPFAFGASVRRTSPLWLPCGALALLPLVRLGDSTGLAWWSVLLVAATVAGGAVACARCFPAEDGRTARRPAAVA